MKIIHTNLMNYFWKKGIEPIKTELGKKIGMSKIVNNLLTTKAGYVLDARQGKVLQDQVDEINSDLLSLFGTMSYAQEYTIPANGYTDVIVDTAVEGKRVIGITMRTTGHPNIYAYSWAVRSDQRVGVGLRNTYNSSLTVKVMIDVLYVRQA